MTSAVGALVPAEPTVLARRLGVSDAAVAIARESLIIDLHIDSFIPMRLWGYDWMARHRGGPFGGRLFGHLDGPRAVDGGLSAAMWSITTNPFRSARGRWRAWQRNFAGLCALVEARSGHLAFARNRAEVESVVSTRRHACLLAIQGGNALEAAPEGVASVPDGLLTRVTVVHLTNSVYSATSSPFSALRRDKGLSDAGRGLIEQLNAARVFVDLAHMHPTAFWQAVEVHDRSQPLVSTHTGVNGVRSSWRNLDDDQIRAIADTGGTIGVIFAAQFLARKGGPRDAQMVVEHMAHIIDVVGDDFVSIGSDYDGAITPPRDLRSGDAYPRLVQAMLERGWSAPRIQKILAGNFLRAFEHLRPASHRVALPVAGC